MEESLHHMSDIFSSLFSFLRHHNPISHFTVESRPKTVVQRRSIMFGPGYLCNCCNKIPKKQMDSPLFQAAKRGDLPAVKDLLSKGHHVDEIGCVCKSTPLMTAVHHNHADVVTFLLDKGADVGRSNSCGKTALHQAAWYGNSDAVRLLVRHGAPLNLQTSETTFMSAGWSPLMLVASSLHSHTNMSLYGEFPGHVDCVRILIDSGADLNLHLPIPGPKYPGDTRRWIKMTAKVLAKVRQHWQIYDLIDDAETPSLKSLRYLASRVVVTSCVRHEDIVSLPLPQTLLRYLKNIHPHSTA